MELDTERHDNESSISSGLVTAAFKGRTFVSHKVPTGGIYSIVVHARYGQVTDLLTDNVGLYISNESSEQFIGLMPMRAVKNAEPIVLSLKRRLAMGDIITLRCMHKPLVLQAVYVGHMVITKERD